MSDILIIWSKGQGQSKSFSPRNWMVRERRENNECLWLQNPTQLPSRWNLAKIGPAKDRISSTGPRVCPREGDNRPELRLAAATKVGFDAKNLQMLWPPLGQGNIKQDTSYHFTYSYFCNFSYDYSTMTYKHDDTVQKRNSWIIHKQTVYRNLKLEAYNLRHTL